MRPYGLVPCRLAGVGAGCHSDGSAGGGLVQPFQGVVDGLAALDGHCLAVGETDGVVVGLQVLGYPNLVVGDADTLLCRLSLFGGFLAVRR